MALSDFYKSVLFHVGSSAFEISTKLAVIVAQWRAQLVCNSAIYDDDDDCLIMIMACGTVLCAIFVSFGSISIALIHGIKH